MICKYLHSSARIKNFKCSAMSSILCIASLCFCYCYFHVDTYKLLYEGNACVSYVFTLCIVLSVNTGVPASCEVGVQVSLPAEQLQEKFRVVQKRAMVHFRNPEYLKEMLRKYERMLSNEEKDFIKTLEAKECFGLFKTYWNFVDYSFLKHSIKEFGTSKLQNDMKKYIADLEQFELNTTIQDYNSPPPDFPEHFIIVTITQKKDPTECTLYDICQFKKELVKQSDEHAILTRISNSRSVVFALAFPPHALTKICGVFNIEFQEKHKIIKVTFSWRAQRMVYDCKSQIQGMHLYTSLPMLCSIISSMYIQRQRTWGAGGLERPHFLIRGG